MKYKLIVCCLNYYVLSFRANTYTLWLIHSCIYFCIVFKFFVLKTENIKYQTTENIKYQTHNFTKFDWIKFKL